MKKSTIKLIAMLLTVVLMLPNFAGAGALNENEVDDGLLTLEEIEEIGRLEAPATKAFEEINDAWTDETGNVNYPNSYGGAYITDGYLLCIKVVNGDSSLQHEIQNIVTNSAVVVFEDCDISRQDLFELRDNLPEELSQLPVVGTGISFCDSSVHVYVPSNAVSEMSSYSLLPEPWNHITIIPYNEVSKPIQTSTFYCGSTFVPNRSTNLDGQAYEIGAFGSLGFYGKCVFEGSFPQECILTAGHVVKALKDEDVGIASGSKTAVPKLWLRNTSYCKTMYDKGTNSNGYYSGDWAVIAYSEFEKTNVMKTTSAGGPYLAVKSALSAGMSELNKKTVFKAAGVSGYKMAKVLEISSSASFPATGDKITGIMSVDSGEFSVPGDSGATVYTTGGNGETVLCGIITGTAGSWAYFTPLYIIVQEVGFVPYLG